MLGLARPYHPGARAARHPKPPRRIEIDPGTGRFTRNESNLLAGGPLVVDETSMVDVLLMHSLLCAIPHRSGLVLVGDVDQLPSVGPGTVLYDLIESEIVPVVRLTEVFRQAANSRIITNAHRIRRGQMPDMSGADPRSDFHFVEREDPEKIAATLVKLVRERIPERFRLDPIRDVQVLCPMNRGSLGVRELNTALQNRVGGCGSKPRETMPAYTPPKTVTCCGKLWHAWKRSWRHTTSSACGNRP